MFRRMYEPECEIDRMCTTCRQLTRNRRQRREWLQDHPRADHPGWRRPWSDADLEHLQESHGRSVEDVARELGRTKAGVIWQIRNRCTLGMRIDHGKIYRRDSA